MVSTEGIQSPSPEHLSQRLPKRGIIFDQRSARHRRISPLQKNPEEAGKEEEKKLFVPDYSKLRTRDESEWTTWIRELTPSFMASVIKRFPNKHVAEDIVQEAWIKTYIRIDAISPDNLNGYVRTCVHNGLNDYFKSASVRLATTAEVPETESPDDTEGKIISQEQFRYLQRYINQLTPEQKQAALDIAFDLTPSDVEKRTGIPAGIIKARRYRAIRTLKSLISSQE